MTRIICTVTNDLTFDQRMIRICTSLSKAGYEVELVGREIPSSVALAEKTFRQKRLRLFFRKGKLFYLEFNLRLFFYLLNSKFDIVCSVDLDTLLPGFIAARLGKKSCVYDAHEFFTEVPEVVERPAVKRAWEWLAWLLIPKLRYAYTVNESLAEIFRRKFGTEFSVIRNLPIAKTLDFELPEKKWEPFILIYQGVLNEGRGLEEMIGAMKFLQGVELWLAGEGDLSECLRRLSAKLQVEEKIKFLGRVSPPALAELTTTAHLGLNLLKNKGLNYYYSLANKAFDYIQAGLPSINMDFPEYRKINETYQVFYLLGNLEVQSLVEAVNFLREEKALYNRMAANCRQAAKELIWEKEEEKLLSIYYRIKISI